MAKQEACVSGRYPLKLAFFWAIQSLWPVIVLLPVFVSQKLTPVQRLTMLHALPLSGFLLGFLWETVADIQKFIFKQRPKNKDLWIQKGLPQPQSLDVDWLHRSL